LQDVQRNLSIQQRLEYGLQVHVPNIVFRDEGIKTAEKARILHQKHRLEERDKKELLVSCSFLFYHRRDVQR
jgi:hypothetical protein